jgi:competence protein ComEA
MKGRSIKYITLLIGCLFGAHSACAATLVESNFSQSNKQLSVKSTVDLNQANLQGLIKIKGLGKRKATAILSYRKKVGKFRSLSELKEIKGIGPKLYALIEPKLTL